LVRGDFARTEHQRDMLLALKEKVFSLGTFSNPSAIGALISTAGKNLRTNLEISEMLRVYEIMSEVPQSNILTYGLDNSADNYLASTNTSDLVPKTGNFLEIQKFVRRIFADGFIKSEFATIDVLNGTSALGQGTKTANLLKSYGYNVVNIANAPADTYQNTIIYDLSLGEAPFTKRLLEQRFGISMLPKSQLPSTIVSTAKFVIIVGADATQN
jgi:hypothetical protein